MRMEDSLMEGTGTGGGGIMSNIPSYILLMARPITIGGGGVIPTPSKMV